LWRQCYILPPAFGGCWMTRRLGQNTSNTLGLQAFLSFLFRWCMNFPYVGVRRRPHLVAFISWALSVPTHIISDIYISDIICVGTEIYTH
jgi:hypothetical protein